MDYKQLKKLADTCRKAGIKHFKNADIEFTLTDDLPVVSTKKSQQADTDPVIDASFKADTLTDEELLYYSVMDNAVEKAS